MDYEVFLLSRVREEYVRTGDNDAAIVRGVSGTARIVTSAAMIMVAVFLSLVVAPDPSYKMLGPGMATAIFVDATVIRMVLVPATMTLLGRANWWQPRWLDRVPPRGARSVSTPGQITTAWAAAHEVRPAVSAQGGRWILLVQVGRSPPQIHGGDCDPKRGPGRLR